MVDPISAAQAGIGATAATARFAQRRWRRSARAAVSRVNSLLPDSERKLSIGERRRLRKVLTSQDSWLEFLDAAAPTADFRSQVRSCLKHRDDGEGARTDSIVANSWKLLATSRDDLDNAILASVRDQRLNAKLDERFARDQIVESSALPRTGPTLMGYRELFRAEIRARTTHGAARFPLLARYSGAEDLALDLLPRLLDRQRLVLTGRAGMGKSTIAAAVAEARNDDGWFVVFLTAKDVPATTDAILGTPELLKASRPTIDSLQFHRFLEELPTTGYALIVVDGLNEVARSHADGIISAVVQIQAVDSRVKALLTDRSATRYEDADSPTVELAPLSRRAVEGVLQEWSVSASDLSDVQLSLLTSSFFLSLALEGKDPYLGTRASAIGRLLGERGGLEPEQVDKLAALGLETLRRKTFRMTRDEVEGAIGPEALLRLIDAQLLVVIATPEDRIEWYHQLIHDYLAARSVAGDRALWSSDTFDALTLQESSTDPLAMVLEMLPSDDDRTAFVTLLYDWHWYATVRLLSDPTVAIASVRTELTLAVSALLAERQFDSVETSANRAKRTLELLDARTGFSLSACRDLVELGSELRRHAQGIERVVDWFGTWIRVFFVGLDGEPNHLAPEDRFRIMAQHSVVGWTVANVLRRSQLSGDEVAALRSAFVAVEDDHTSHGETVRWRIVHALGHASADDGVEFLVHVLDSSSDRWVLYGAVRSLLEVAAQYPESRDAVMSALARNLNRLDGEPATQLTWSSQNSVLGDKPDWIRRMIPLIDDAAARPMSAEESVKWEHRRQHFMEWAES